MILAGPYFRLSKLAPLCACLVVATCMGVLLPVQAHSAPPEKHQAPKVSISDQGKAMVLENGIVSLKIDKSSANMLGLRYNGVDLLDGSGYWNVYGETPGQQHTQEKGTPSIVTVTQDPLKNGGEIGEIELTFPYKPGTNAEPLDLSIRYTLRRGDSGVYGWTSVTHKPGYPAFNVEISTVAMKLKAEIFDHLTIDSRRNKDMITGSDWIHGEHLNLKEARRMTTGIYVGQVEHKYDYSAVLADTPAYGWTSTKKNVGVWIVNPSIEYINGGPTRVELTGHIDLKDSPPVDPTLLFIWHGSHYGGMPIQIGSDEQWNKTIGPFLIYCNSAPGPDAMWKDALARAAEEKHEWPYAWAKAPGYASAADRGAVTGKLTVRDPQQPSASAANAWVGLTPAPFPGLGQNRKPITINWEDNGKYYEYWTRADQAGSFDVSNARPGKYVLTAYNDGILGEYSKADVTIEAGKTIDLGSLTWVPVRYGRQVWDIGIPNRSAAEFRHGDHYWVWGNYNLYPQEFPDDVNFMIGKSNWAKDWNYAQPAKQQANGKWTGTTWKIKFDMANAKPGKATLRLAICGSRGNSLDVSVNGKPIGSSGDLPNSGVMHRDGIQAVETFIDLPFDTSMLVDGPNEIELTSHAKDWTDGILYDYLRLEIDESGTATIPAKQPR